MWRESYILSLVCGRLIMRLWDQQAMRWFRRQSPEDSIPVNAVYTWRSWKGYYVKDVVPGAFQVRAKPTDSAENILSRLPSTIRRFLFHVDLTETTNFPADRMLLVDMLRVRSHQCIELACNGFAQAHHTRSYTPAGFAMCGSIKERVMRGSCS